MGLGFWAGFGVWGFGFRVLGKVVRVWGLGFRVLGFGFRDLGKSAQRERGGRERYLCPGVQQARDQLAVELRGGGIWLDCA